MTFIIIGTIGLISISVFIRQQILRRQSKTALFNDLNEITESMDLKISKLDHFSKKLVALDSVKKIFVFLDYRNSKNNLIVDLNEVKECTIIVKLLAIQLEVVYNNLQKPSSSVVFYRKFIDPAIVRRKSAKKIRKWERLLFKVTRRNQAQLQTV